MKVPLRLRRLVADEDSVLVLMTIAVGLLAGLGAVALEFSLRLIQRLAMGPGGDTGTLQMIRIFLAPALGALVAGPLIARFAREAKGHGVPEVMQAVAINGGRIRARVAIVKIIASALTIGTGGSAGREGPIVQVGATLGSQVGRVLRMTEQRVQLLVACGAAAGVAAVFNAPMAGMFFSFEVILQRLTTRGLATVVLSSVTATVTWRWAFGNQPVLQVPLFGLGSPIELLFYAFLGLLAAGVGILFVRVLYGVEDWFDENKTIPEELKPLMGGLALGVMGVVLLLTIKTPMVYGTGLPGINMALAGQLSWMTMLILVIAKMAATSATLGSGASGGVFAPSLFMGAMLGGGLGAVLHALWPALGTHAGAYAMVGMAAVFAGVGQAPITAVLILFEMTNDYAIIVPLMLACFVAARVYARVQGDSIYTMKLRRRGVDLSGGRERHLLERTLVTAAMRRDFPSLRLPASTEDAVEMTTAVGRDFLTVLHGDGRLAGIVLAARLHELQEDLAAQAAAAARTTASAAPAVGAAGSGGPPATGSTPATGATETSGVRRLADMPAKVPPTVASSSSPPAPPQVTPPPIRLAVAEPPASSAAAPINLPGTVPLPVPIKGLPPLEKVLDTRPPFALASDSLDVALRKMAPRGLYALPVLDNEETRRVLGQVTRDGILSCYSDQLVNEQARVTQQQRLSAQRQAAP